MRNTCCVLIAVLFVAACAPGVRDAEWFKAHVDERDAKLAECRASTTAFTADKECIAAHLAEDVLPVSWWRKNSEERKARLAECKEHSASLATSGNCVNASQAANAALGAGAPVYLK